MLSIPDISDEQVNAFAWRVGRLKYKLQPQQKLVYDIIDQCPPEEIFAVVCSRGFGKTFIGCTKVLETARRSSAGSNILIISSTLKKLRTIVKPAFDTLLQDCPAELQPKYNSQDSVYEFPNGVRVHLCAAEKGHIKDLRGIHNVVLVLLDEAGFFGDENDSFPLDYVVESILNPMFLRASVRARIIMMSTPPEVPNHPFNRYEDEAAIKGCSAKFTIYQSDIPPQRIEEEKTRCKNIESWRREYLCERVVDSSRMIFPEWNTKLYMQDPPTDQFFPFYHKYSALDTGVRDFTCNLLYHYDFKRAKLIFDDEVVLRNEEVRTDILAEKIKEKEERLYWPAGSTWDQKSATKNVYRRIGDNSNLLVLQDLSGIHGLPFLPTTKDELFAMVNEVRLWINTGRIIVRPSCRYLVGCLENGTWDKNKKEFARSSVYGHYDALAALCYAVRNVDVHTNPIPATFGFSVQTHHVPVELAKRESETYRTIKQAIKLPQLKRTTDDWRSRRAA